MRRRGFLLAGGVAIGLANPQLRALADAGATCEVAVIGGGVGGCAAALAALRRGCRVILTEESDWLGGQLTSQAVPPDEHPWIESFGCTRSYRQYRNAIREYYRQHYPLTAAAAANPQLNPGNGSVSRLTHECKVSVAVLEAMMTPYSSSGQLRVFLNSRPLSVSVNRDHIKAVHFESSPGDVSARYFIDATETGSLLALSKTEFVTGAESRDVTGELHAAEKADPTNMQAITFCFAMEYREGEDFANKPSFYDEWKNTVLKVQPRWPGPQFSWTDVNPQTLETRRNPFAPNPGVDNPKGNWWTYRRIADRRNFSSGYPSDITLVNWPQNDFIEGDVLSDDAVVTARAKQLSLSFLYWMQTEAPRPDGGVGFKGLRLRPDIIGTGDGLAKRAYVRESRRIQAEFTVLEQHVGAEMRAGLLKRPVAEIRAESFHDSVGIGCYRIDLHPSTGGNNYIDVSSLPFQIPLGALIPRRMENLLAGAKNIGTTHITNGCYRLHPVEWNIGEAAGAVAAHAVRTKKTPRQIRNSEGLLADFKKQLRDDGFELEWPDGVHAV